VGEVCPVIVVMMPFGVPLWAAFWLRKWLRKRLGRRVGDAVGGVAVAMGRVPFAVPCVVFRLVGWLRRRTMGKAT
jgi:hypothetical protein